MVLCPECDQKIVVNRPRMGQRIICSSCEAELEVISVHPLELDWADFEDEDWDDEDWDNED